MSHAELRNKPLVEAIFEMHWALQQKAPGVALDPHYRLLLSRLYDRLLTTYPEHEQLDAARLPEEMAGHAVQHRFRTAKDDWPLVQLGPGVLTVNDTHKYKWEDFCARLMDVQGKLYAAYPDPNELRVESLFLRYIDAVDLDYPSSSVFQFLQDKLKISISLPQNLFENTNVEALPQHFESRQMYRSTRPLGVINLRFATGQWSNEPALIWETTIQSAGPDLPKMPEGFEAWLDQAHTLVNDWFFKMIEGDLYRRFSGE